MTDMKTPRIELDDVEYVNETPYAILIETGSGTIWVPKAFADWDADEGILIIEEWLARERGLI